MRKMLASALVALALVACGDDDDPAPDYPWYSTTDEGTGITFRCTKVYNWCYRPPQQEIQP